MRISVNDIELAVCEDGYPYWFHISRGAIQIGVFKCLF